MGCNFPRPQVPLVSLDATAYIQQILSPFIPHLPRATRNRLTFMQDGASCHTAAETARFLQEYNVRVIPDWPANSPDLNPIENLWSYIEYKLKNRVCSSDNDLWCQIEREWNAVPISMLHTLHDSMPTRLREVRKAKGRTIKY